MRLSRIALTVLCKCEVVIKTILRSERCALYALLLRIGSKKTAGKVDGAGRPWKVGGLDRKYDGNGRVKSALICPFVRQAQYHFLRPTTHVT